MLDHNKMDEQRQGGTAHRSVVLDTLMLEQILALSVLLKTTKASVGLIADAACDADAAGTVVVAPDGHHDVGRSIGMMFPVGG